MSMKTPNTNKSENLKKNKELIPYEYKMEHTHVEFIRKTSAAVSY